MDNFDYCTRMAEACELTARDLDDAEAAEWRRMAGDWREAASAFAEAPSFGEVQSAA